MSAKRTLEQTLQSIHELAESVAKPLGLVVVDVKFGQQGRRKSIEVTIFRRGGSVGLSDCETVSRQLEALIDGHTQDEYPLIEGAYVLEVQSPGIDRQLKSERDFKLFAGQNVIVQAKEKIEDLGATFTATLVGSEEGKLKFAQAKSAPMGKQKEVVTVAELTVDMKKLSQVKLHSGDLAAKHK